MVQVKTVTDAVKLLVMIIIPTHLIIAGVYFILGDVVAVFSAIVAMIIWLIIFGFVYWYNVEPLEKKQISLPLEEIERPPEISKNYQAPRDFFANEELETEDQPIIYETVIERPQIVLKEESFICDICKNSITEDVVNCPNCDTHFHYRCLGEWVKTHGECPRCKAELSFKYK